MNIMKKRIILILLAACLSICQTGYTDQLLTNRAGAALGSPQTFISIESEKPSFDCNKVNAPQEKLICTTAALSKLDRELFEKYKEILKKLTEYSQEKAFRNSQREWVKYRQALCPAPQSLPDGLQASVGCLQELYEKRLEKISKGTLFFIGPYTFLNLEHFKVTATKGEDEEWRKRWPNHSSVIEELRLVFPPSSLVEIFNNEMKKEFEKYEKYLSSKREEDIDAHISIMVHHADVSMINIQIVNFMYNIGAVHGGTYMCSINWLLKEGRMLKADDLFIPGSNWQDAVANFAFQELNKQYKDDLFDFIKSPGDIRKLVEDQNNWILGPEAFVVRFGQYSVAPYSAGILTVEIPWDELKSYIISNPPLAFKVDLNP